MLRFALASLALLGASCESKMQSPPAAPDLPAPAEGFTFSTYVVRQLDVTVVDGLGRGLQGASVELATVRDGDGTSTGGSEFFGRGFTDDEGRCAMAMRVPAAVQQVDLIVHRPGWAGPYTSADVRETDGLTAVSSRTTRATADLRDIRIQLTGGVR